MILFVGYVGGLEAMWWLGSCIAAWRPNLPSCYVEGGCMRGLLGGCVLPSMHLDLCGGETKEALSFGLVDVNITCVEKGVGSCVEVEGAGFALRRR